MLLIDTQVTNAKIAYSQRKQFFHSLQLYLPRFDSQHDIVSTTAGIKISKIEKNTAPTSAMNGLRVGSTNRTITVTNTIYKLMNIRFLGKLLYKM